MVELEAKLAIGRTSNRGSFPLDLIFAPKPKTGDHTSRGRKGIGRCSAKRPPHSDKRRTWPIDMCQLSH
jgi:hypothetical protein